MSLGVAAAVAVVLPLALGGRVAMTAADLAVGVLLGYLLTYLVVTVVAFTSASEDAIEEWGERDSRGTLMQRYVWGTAPGPGVSTPIAAGAFGVAVLWMPGHLASAHGQPVRVAVAALLVVAAWAAVLVAFAITFYADNLVEDKRALAFPGGDPRWASYVYFAISVMTTFGATDVEVVSDPMRRTVSVNAVVAFVFNTVIVATVVSMLTAA